MKHEARISKLMSYLLRHNPMGLSVPRDGLAEVEDLWDLEACGEGDHKPWP
jgi:RNA:NAD 2'-phosphotransferase (TPT1/KptA family)